MRKVTERRYQGRYSTQTGRRILKTALLYGDRKTQVPKKVIEILRLTPGESTIVWVQERGRIYIESEVQEEI